MQNYRLCGVDGIQDLLTAAVSLFPGTVLFQLRFIVVFRMIFFTAHRRAGCWKAPTL
jgi:hypothetical protein